MHNAPFFLKYKLHHVFFWMLVFGVWYFLRYEDYALEITAFKITFVKVIDLALMVYVTNYLLIPKLLYKKRYVWFTLCFVIMIVSSSLLKMQIIGQILGNPALFKLSAGNLKVRIYDNVIPHFFLVIAGAAFKLMSDYGEMQKHMAEMAKEKAEAELNFLKSQINPHFLFNSLNSVYFLIDKENKDARNALHKFSDMLRYQLYEANGEKIPIEKEISYLRDYVDLQRLRKDENYDVQFQCSPEVKDFSIEPLLLVPFVENAFKHISHKSGKKNFVKLDLTRQNGYFDFKVENSKEAGTHHSKNEGGIGLGNVKRRLELLYPDTHQLSIHEQDDTFNVILKIKI